MRPLELLAETRTPDGTLLSLTRRDREYIILAAGKPLMSSRMHGSEQALATFGCRNLPAEGARVLVGGLGMGFTLRATLDVLPCDGSIIVAELIPAVVEWNRGPLGPLAGHPLKDTRVSVALGDVGAAMRASAGRFDAILLDVDNGPDAFTATGNASLYDNAGIAAARDALRPGGTLAVWSAWEDRKFEQRLKFAGLDVKVERVRARLKAGGPRHTIFLGHRPVQNRKARLR
jgi:spermidine synthase